MRTGPLRHRVTIQSPAAGEDKYGAPVEGWNDDLTVWAQISPQSGREVDAAQQTIGETTFEVTMRYRQIEPAQRLLHSATGTVYDIREVRPPNIPDMLTLVCTVGTTDG